MVSRHPLLRHLAVMVLVVLLPCMSDAATPINVTSLLSSITTTQIRSLLNGFLDENALNIVHSFDVKFSTTANANAAIATLKNNYPAASTSQSGTHITIGQISGFTVNDVLALLNPYIYNFPSNMYPIGQIKSVVLYYRSRSEASTATTNINTGRVSGVSSAKMNADVPNPTSPVNAVVVVKTTPDITATQASTFIKTFRADDAHNRVSGLGARFTSSNNADTVVNLMTSTFPAASITRRSAEEVGVSGLSDFNQNAVYDIEYQFYHGVTDITLNFGSKSAADATTALVNSGIVPGFSSAESIAADDYFFPLGGIIGIVIAVNIIHTVVAVGVYWKFLMSSGRDVQGDTADALL